MAGGVDIFHRAKNGNLGQDLTTKGLRISEQPIGIAQKARDFPSHNRLFSGLCSGVIIVEVAAKSGSLINARDAPDQGREVLVVRGYPFDERAAGCKMLLREGPILVSSIDNVV